MGEAARAGMRRSSFAACVAAILALVTLQSVVHLAVVLGSDRVGTAVDVDRSNGLSDLASTTALVIAAIAAAQTASSHGRPLGAAALALSVGLTALALADLVHDGPHPASAIGWLVIIAALSVALLLLALATGFSRRAQLTLAVAGCLLVASFCVNALDELDAQRFERERGDQIREYEVVTKEGLELLGWSLVALGLWDEALRRRNGRPAARARASRPRAPRRPAA
jgi:hypothetical protein